MWDLAMLRLFLALFDKYQFWSFSFVHTCYTYPYIRAMKSSLQISHSEHTEWKCQSSIISSSPCACFFFFPLHGCMPSLLLKDLITNNLTF